MQLIGFKDLQIECIIGLYPEERGTPQTLLIDLSVDTKEFVDYAEAAALLTELAIGGRYELIETLAHDAALAIRTKWPAIRAVTITIKKPAALKKAAYAFAKVEL
jgi:dihydroneopterin aldolase